MEISHVPLLKEVTVSERKDKGVDWTQFSGEQRDSLVRSSKICLWLGILKSKVRNGGKRFHLKESSILMNKDSGLKSTGLSVIFLRNESGTYGLGTLSLETM